ncbi:hypothetical protein DFH06DRAFT_1316356 [Mycena polygramma]|nr:hypothetical protein DFH06DRAFT_1316356 [Mycena polygramma]
MYAVFQGSYTRRLYLCPEDSRPAANGTPQGWGLFIVPVRYLAIMLALSKEVTPTDSANGTPVQASSDGLAADGASTSSHSTKSFQPYTPDYPTTLELPPPNTDGGVDFESFLDSCFPDDAMANGLPTNDPWLYDVDPRSMVIPTLPDLGLAKYPELSTPPFENTFELPSLPRRSPFSDSPPYGNFSLKPAAEPDRTAELFELRNLFLNHCWHYGLNVTAEKRDALSRGDTSGHVVHRVLVHVCQLLGYHLANRFPSSTHQGPTAGREAEQAMLIFDILQGSVDVPDPTTSMQVYNLLGGYYAMKGDLPIFTQLFEKLGKLVLQSSSIIGLDEGALELDPASQVAPVSCCPQGSTQEARSAFSSMIFIELTVSLVPETPPILDPSLLAKFRRLAAIHRRDTELNFVRARSALFLYDTQHLVAEWSKLNFDNPSRTVWSKRYWHLIEDIHAHLAVINTPLIEVSFIHAAQVFTLKTCIIIALAALADLYALFAPFQPESLRQRNAVVDEIAGITSMFIGSDFDYLDRTLGVRL